MYQSSDARALFDFALRKRAKTAYLDGELCGVARTAFQASPRPRPRPMGRAACAWSFTPSTSCISTAATRQRLPLVERKALLEPIVADIPGLQFNGHEIGDGELVRRHACQLGFEGIVSKTADAPYASGNRGLWRKAKCLNRQEFVVVGWTDPEGSRPHLGALLLGYYTDDGKLIYAGRVGTGMSQKVLKDLRRRLDPLARPKSPLSAPPPRSTRFGSPLVLSRVHWVEPKLVAEITYLTWTADNLLRQTVYVGLREDKQPWMFGGNDWQNKALANGRLRAGKATLRRRSIGRRFNTLEADLFRSWIIGRSR